MKVNPSQFSEITEKYSAGVGSRQLATEYGVSAATINRVVRQTTGVSRVRLTDSQCLEVSSQYESGRSMTEIATTFGVYASTISRLLQKVGVRKPSESGRKKGGFTPEEKESIIDLYVNQHRGKEYIATLYGRSDANVSYWLEKWKIDTTPRSEIMTTIRQVYGPTTGFNGRLHSTSSKAEIASSMRADWQRGTRLPNIGKSRMYDTVVGRVLGRFEVAYLQMCHEANEKLPELCHKRYQTPYGTYKPDFVVNGKFIEIKSKFTLRVAQGLYHNNKGKYCDKQWKKICWFKENIASLEVIVLDSNEARSLFSRANSILV